MKRSFIFFYFFLAFTPLFVNAEDEEEYNWYYVIDYVSKPDSYQIGMESDGDIADMWSEEYWYTEGTEIVNGKTYKKLYIREESWDVKAFVTFPKDEDLYKVHVLDIREDNGRIYALKEMYIDYLNHHASTEELNSHDIFLAPAEDDNEVLLYDYTLGEGDPYPSMDFPTVKRVEYIHLNNNEEKKVLRLSNGLVVIEDIGCINSLGTLACYQNQRVKDTYPEGYLFGYLNNYGKGENVLFKCQECPSLYTKIHQIATKEIDKDIYDLKGRKLPEMSKKKGIFIQNGKKVAVR